MKALLAAALLFCATAASAEGETTASFRFSGIQFELPIPAGYCLPQGGQIDWAQWVAAADDLNVTHLTLIACPQPANVVNDYILVKTPRQALFAPIEREQLLNGMDEAFQSAELTEAFRSGRLTEESAESLSRVLGRRIDLTGSVAPLGRDDVCAYLGGTMQVSSDIASYPISFGACITAIADRVVVVYWYGPGGGSTGVAELLLRARALALQISGRPAG